MENGVKVPLLLVILRRNGAIPGLKGGFKWKSFGNRKEKKKKKKKNR
jgi:hypothetical protein